MKATISAFGVILFALIRSSAYLDTQVFNFVSQPLDFTNLQTTDFNQFDPALGTLNSVTIIYSIEVDSGNLIVDNDGADEIDTNFSASINASLADDDAVVVVFPTLEASDTINGSATLGPNQGDAINNIDSSAPDGTLFDLSPLSASNSVTYTNASPFQFNSYIGTGTFNFELDAIRGFTIDAAAAEGGFGVTLASGTVTVQYDITPVPEPALGGVLAAVLVGFCCYRRS